MTGLTTTQIAAHLTVTKGRISQLVKDGTLDGCYTGQGRGRRFDPAKVAERLQRKLDPGQMMGNGSGTKKRIKSILGEQDQSGDQATSSPEAGHSRYELARIKNAEEDLKRKQRETAAAEGTMVLVSEVQQQIAKIVGQEVAEFDSVLRDAAAVLAETHGLDVREVKQVLIDEWRSHRAKRRDTLHALATEAGFSEAEREADI